MIANKFSHNTIFTRSALFIWLLFACSYFVLKKIPDASIFSAYLTLIGEAGLDLMSAILMIGFGEHQKPVKVFSNLFVSFLSDCCRYDI